MSGLVSLIERVEKASGPDRELDGDIVAYLQLHPMGWRRGSKEASAIAIWFDDNQGCQWRAPDYSASLDAVRTLNDRDIAWTVGKNVHHGYWHASCNALNNDGEPYSVGCSGACKTPALALLSAILKARHAREARE